MSTPVMSPEKIVRYAETRLFGGNIHPEDVNAIHLHNGILPSHLEHMLDSIAGQGYVRLAQQNEREPIFYKDGGLHIPQYSGFGRRRRYESVITAYIEASGRDIAFRSLEFEGIPRKTDHAYDNFAYNFVEELFKTEPMHEFATVIFGPLGAVAKQARVLKERPDEYLPSQLVSVTGRNVLNIGYIYSDQVGILIDKMLIEYNAIARQLNRHMTIPMYMFGRVGGLGKTMRRHDLVFPTSIIDSTDLNDGQVFIHQMNNILAGEQRFVGPNLNVNMVIGQTIELLQRAASRNIGCVCVEMETREAVDSVNQGRRRYTGTLRQEFGFVGHVSDLPLKGDTLDKELDSDRGEQAAVATILASIASSQA